MKRLSSIITLAIIMLLLFSVNVSSGKKGVAGPGGCPDVPPLPAFYHTLGIDWAYSWAYCNWFTGVEYVPMARSIHNNFGVDDVNKMISHYGTGIYWLIGNEPDGSGQDNLTPVQAAEIYGNIAQTILGVDPSAKIIMLGLTNGGWGGREYLRNFRAAWKDRWNFDVDDVVTGYHIHAYAHMWGGCTQDEAIAREQTYIQAFRIEIDRVNPNAELWITEFGTLYGPYANTTHVMNVMTPWLESYSGVDRYAWFYFGHPDCDFNNVALYTCAEEISPLGRLYASLGTPILPTLVPSVVPTSIPVTPVPSPWPTNTSTLTPVAVLTPTDIGIPTYPTAVAIPTPPPNPPMPDTMLGVAQEQLRVTWRLEKLLYAISVVVTGAIAWLIKSGIGEKNNG